MISSENSQPDESYDVIETGEFNFDLVENTLREMGSQGVMLRLRHYIQHNEFFGGYEEDEGVVLPDDASAVGNVFSLLREQLISAQKGDTESYFYGGRSDNVVSQLVKSLEEGAKERAILLAYFKLDENTPWFLAQHAITTIQRDKDPDFPDISTTTEVFERLQTTHKPIE